MSLNFIDKSLILTYLIKLEFDNQSNAI